MLDPGDRSNDPDGLLDDEMDMLLEQALEAAENAAPIPPPPRETHRAREKKPQRRLPGPAGNLPTQKNGPAAARIPPAMDSHRRRRPTAAVTLLDATISPITSSSPAGPTAADREFGEHAPTWRRLSNHVDALGLRPRVQPVASLLTARADPRAVGACKADCLVVLIQAVTARSETDATVVLRDRSGFVPAALHHKVLQTHGAQIVAGAGLVLRDVSVFRPSSQVRYVNVTLPNVALVVPAGCGPSSGTPPSPTPRPRAPSSADVTALLEGLAQDELFDDMLPP